MLIVYKIHHHSQEPVLLDIDHPPQTPQSTADAFTPHRSPPYSSHSATSMRRPLLNAQTWESPAFLKRNQFISGYEAFVTEEEAEFPDNDRRKRPKFGRGSGQWRFADTTPSPEKEPDTDGLEVASPPRPQYEEQAICNTAGLELRGSQKIEDHARVTVEEQGIREPSEDLEGKSKLNGQLNEVGQQMHQEVSEDVDNRTPSNAPPSPPSTTAELSEAKALGATTATNEAAPSSPHSIYTGSRSSESNQASGVEAEGDSQLNNSDDAAFSGPASDFGLDGSVFSRNQQSSKEHFATNTTTEESVRGEDDDAVIRSPEQEARSPSVSDTEEVHRRHDEEPSTIVESAHEFQIPDDDDSVQNFEHDAVGQDIRDPLGVPPFPSDQLRGQQVLEGPSSHAVKTVANLELQGLPPESMAVTTVDRAPSVVEPLNGELELAEPQETNKGKAELTTQPSKALVSRNEIINLESDSDEDDAAQMISQQHTRSPSIASDVPVAISPTNHSDFLTPVGIATFEEPPSLLLSTSKPSFAEQPKDAVPQLILASRKPLDQMGLHTPPSQTPSPSITEDVIDDSLQSIMGVEISSIQEEPRSSTALGQLPDIGKQVYNLESAPDPSTDQSGLETGVRETSLSDEPAEIRSQKENSLIAEQSFSPQPTSVEFSPKPTPSTTTKAESQSSFVELAATVQDSARAPTSKSQLLTPDETQRTSFASQPSFNSLLSTSDNENLPTLRLTQVRSAEPALLKAHQISREPSPTISIPPLEKHEIPSETQRSDQKASVPQRPPTLIERLKAMKRLSSQTPQRTGDANAISPWFAPKRPSIVVPDSEAESEIEILSENDRKSIKQNVTAKLQTPEKQHYLAKSFIRSPPQPEGIHSIASSPGYLPPSQPPPPGFRTSLSYFVPLATLRSHFTLAVDVVAIVLSATSITRATSGPTDYNQTIYITDPSSSVIRSPVITAQIFRSHNKCFPLVEEGDALLLRDFKVQSFQRQLSLLSTQSSAWAEFRGDADVQVRGPPVEFGAEERGFARGLRRWWAGLDRGAKDGLRDGVPKDKKGWAIPLDRKLNGRVLPNERRLINNKDNSNAKIKKEGITGLGVDLPGSQGKTRISSKRERFLEVKVDLTSSQGKMRKAPPKERSLEFDGIMESTEQPKRILRPRGVRGKTERSESPLKALSRRSETVFTGGLGEPESE